MDRNRADEKLARLRRQTALDRNEFRYPTEPRTAAAGATSFPVKALDEATQKLIRDFIDVRPLNTAAK